jgi:hypothetical protein
MDQPIDPRNRLNDLPNREFLKATKSFWVTTVGRAPTGLELRTWEDFVSWLREARGDEAVENLLGQLLPSVTFSRTPPRSGLKVRHPATFSEGDVGRLIDVFTKPGGRVLDPFVGSGSTLVACAQRGRRGVGIELSPEWAATARERLATEAGPGARRQRLIQDDARQALRRLRRGSCDLLLTSPPYWSVLRKKPGLKAKAERVKRDLPTYYSESAADLGNIRDYSAFLQALGEVFALAIPRLAAGAYACVIVSDFRHGKRFYLHHADVANALEGIGLPLKALTILAQDNKNLYPFGIPYHFVSNIHHQYVLIHQRPR